MSTIPETPYTICLTFFSEKVVALRRLVISLSRGCRQVPGLSLMRAEGASAVFTGVEGMASSRLERMRGAFCCLR